MSQICGTLLTRCVHSAASKPKKAQLRRIRYAREQPWNTAERKHVQGALSALLHFPMSTNTRTHTHARLSCQSALKRGDVKSFTHPEWVLARPCWSSLSASPDAEIRRESRSEARCPVGLSPVPQPVNNTDRQTDVHTNTHTRCFGVSDVCRDHPLTWVCPMFHTLSSGKTRSEQRPRPSAVTRRTHTQRLDVSTQPHSCSWLLRAHCSLHTAAAHAHFDSGFCLRVGSPNFYCSARNKPTGPNTRPVPSQKPPHPPAPRAWTPQPHWWWLALDQHTPLRAGVFDCTFHKHRCHMLDFLHVSSIADYIK